MQCAEWQNIGDKASEWQTLRDEDATKVSWEDVYLDLASTYEHVLTQRDMSYDGDLTLAGIMQSDSGTVMDDH